LRYLFENYAFDTDRRELHRGADLLSIAPQVFDLLDYLIRNRERVVSKDDLISVVWSGRIVSDAALTTRLNAARNAIGDSGKTQRLIKTLPRKGFRFVGEVRKASESLGPEVANNLAGPKNSTPTVPNKPSIAVLPFINLSSDPEQEYFGEGIVEDIITALSRFKSLFVIARNSTFTYKGKTVDVGQVGRDLCVRYVLEGSVRKAGNRVRITVKLIEATAERSLWAEKFDSALEDMFDLQDQITAGVVGLIAPKIEQAEIERAKQKPTDRLDSYDFYLRGTALFNKRLFAKARELFKEAYERDRDYAAAYAMAAFTFGTQQGVDGLVLTVKMRDEGLWLANMGAKLANEDALVLARSGHTLVFLGQYDRGASMVEQAVALNPNLAVAWACRGWVSLMCGQADRSVESFENLIRLSPFDSYTFLTGISWALWIQGRYDEGRSQAKNAMLRFKNISSICAYVANSVCAGHQAEARTAIRELLKLDPGFCNTRAFDVLPLRPPQLRERLAAALREVGLPD
jgi:TolB-like protein/Tfp pilus assembly protein PilF